MKIKFSQKDLFITVIISMIVVAVFSLGYFISNLIKFDKPAIVIEKTNLFDNTENLAKLQPLVGTQVVASVNSDKYHYKYCPGAKRIKEKNKIYFENASEAIGAGFVLANNCK